MPISACPPDHRPCRKAVDPGDALADEVADGGRRRRQGILEPKLPDQRAELLGPQFLKSRHIAGQPFDESRHLLRREGNQDHEGDDEDQDEQDQDQQACAQAPDADLLQPVGQGIEQIGQREARHERQEDAAQDEQQQHRDDERRNPEPDLPLDRHRYSIP